MQLLDSADQERRAGLRKMQFFNQTNDEKCRTSSTPLCVTLLTSAKNDQYKEL